jgi:enoyl-CoA hydratase
MDNLSVEINEGIATITIDRPPANAFVLAMYDGMVEIIKDLDTRLDDVHAIIIRSTGRMFVAGNEISEFLDIEKGEQIVDYTRHVADCMDAIYNARVPVIAAVQGVCVGGGLAIAASCDMIVAGEKAMFGVPEVQVGLIGCGDFFRLMVPEKIARQYVYSADMIPAAEVRQYGGVNKLVAPGEEYDAAVALAKTFMIRAPRGVEFFKQAMNETLDRRLREKYRTEIGYSEKHLEYPDFKESVNAFLEKRPPNFTGRK